VSMSKKNVLQVERDMQVVAFSTVSGYCDAWDQKAKEIIESGCSDWVGVDAEMKALGLHVGPSQQHLAWSVAAGITLHTSEFDYVTSEFDTAYLVAIQAVRLAATQGVVHV